MTAGDLSLTRPELRPGDVLRVRHGSTVEVVAVSPAYGGKLRIDTSDGDHWIATPGEPTPRISVVARGPSPCQTLSERIQSDT